MKIHKKDFDDLCSVCKMDPGIDPTASWRKIQEYYCSQLAYVVCPGYCFRCIDTIETILKMQNSGTPDEKLIEYTARVAKQMTEEYDKNGHKNPYDNEHPSPVDSVNIWRDEQTSTAVPKKK